MARELVLALARNHVRGHEARGNQSAFVREAVELVVDAAETVASDQRNAELDARAAELRSGEERAFRHRGA